MWKSHQPFVIPMMVRNFEDPRLTTPHRSVEMQRNHDILGDIKNKIVEEQDNPILHSICCKLSEIEKEDIDQYQKTVKLYQNIEEDARKYLKDLDCLYAGDDGHDYAVKYTCYNSLKDNGTTGS